MKECLRLFLDDLSLIVCGDEENPLPPTEQLKLWQEAILL